MTISNVVLLSERREKLRASNLIESGLNAEFLLQTLLYLNLDRKVLKYTIPVTVKGNVYHITSVLSKQENPNLGKSFSWETFFHGEEIQAGDLVSFAGDRS